MKKIYDPRSNKQEHKNNFWEAQNVKISKKFYWFKEAGTTCYMKLKWMQCNKRPKIFEMNEVERHIKESQSGEGVSWAHKKKSCTAKERRICYEKIIPELSWLNTEEIFSQRCGHGQQQQSPTRREWNKTTTAKRHGMMNWFALHSELRDLPLLRSSLSLDHGHCQHLTTIQTRLHRSPCPTWAALHFRASTAATAAAAKFESFSIRFLDLMMLQHSAKQREIHSIKIEKKKRERRMGQRIEIFGPWRRFISKHRREIYGVT